MAVVDRLTALLPPETAGLLAANRDRLTEVRLRAGRPVQLRWCGGEALAGEALAPEALSGLLAALMEYSVYARQDELDRGYFTLDDGSRVGVCGRMYRDGDRLRMGEAAFACLRIARPVPGCADLLMGVIAPPEGLRSTLLVSPPGLGKTTLLRDAARQLSEAGRCVALADERHELAACRRGVPALDVGPRTDVMDGCPRSEAIAMMLRTMAPEVVVADEIGGAADARALADAARCGMAVIASAHGEGMDDMRARPCLAPVLAAGVIRRAVLLGPRPGEVREVWHRCDREGEPAWRRA